eukprot:SM000308S11822  [mRNA]  locus=s308:82698:105864:+ [translate_table: standard]
MLTVADVEELSQKLLSDRAKLREEGLRDLQSYLDGTARATLSAMLTERTASQQSDETIALELASSKKRGPRPILSKVLRAFVQKSEESGTPVLLRKIRTLFQHITDVLQHHGSLSSDYGYVLRQLLRVPQYRARLGKKPHRQLLQHHLHKAKSIPSLLTEHQAGVKEEAFRNILSLLSLLEHAPGDLSLSSRGELLESFVCIFTDLREEGRAARKLLAAVNTFLTMDGLNLGDRVATLHLSIQRFMSQFWQNRDRELKDELVLYAKLQIKLQGIQLSGTDALTELGELLEQELDQTTLVTTTSTWFSERRRDEKQALASLSLEALWELAAATFLEVSLHMISSQEHCQRDPDLRFSDNQKQRHTACKASKTVYHVPYISGQNISRQKRVKELVELKQAPDMSPCIRLGALCRLIHDYGAEVPEQLLLDWTIALHKHLQRIFADGVASSGTNNVIWTVRSASIEDRAMWKPVWDGVLHLLVSYSGSTIMVDEELLLLTSMAQKRLVPRLALHKDLWDVSVWSERPTLAGLLFVKVLCTSGQRLALGATSKEDLKLRNKLLEWVLQAPLNKDTNSTQGITLQDRSVGSELAAVLLAITTGESRIEGSSAMSSEDSHLRNAARKLQQAQIQDNLEIERENGPRFNAICYLDRSPAALACCGRPKGMEENVESSSSYLYGLEQSEKRTDLAVAIRKDIQSAVHNLFNSCTRWIRYDWRGELTFSTVAMLSGKDGAKPQQVPEQVISDADLASISHLALLPDYCLFLDTESGEKLAGEDQALQILVSFFLFLREQYLLAARSREYSKPSSETKDLLSGISVLSKSHARVTMIHDDDLDATPLRFTGGKAIASTIGTPGLPSNSSKEGERQRPLVATAILAETMVVVGQRLPRRAFELLLVLLHETFEHKDKCEVLRCMSSLVTSDNVDLLPSLDEECQVILLHCVEILAKSLNRGTSVLQLTRRLVAAMAAIVDMQPVFWHTRAQLAKSIAAVLPLGPEVCQETLGDYFLGLVNDEEYRVHQQLSQSITILFLIWEDHFTLFSELRNVVKTQQPPNLANTCSQALGCDSLEKAETYATTLGVVAAASANVESEIIFLLSTHAAEQPSHRLLIAAVFDHLALELKYSVRWKLLQLHTASLAASWVSNGLSLQALFEEWHLFLPDGGLRDFAEWFSPYLLPPLLLTARTEDITYIAKVLNISTPKLVMDNFAPTFGAILPLYQTNVKEDTVKASSVLQGLMLEVAEISENERDLLISKKLLSIVSVILSHTSVNEEPKLQQYSKQVIVEALRTVIDGFWQGEEPSQPRSLIDQMNILRPDRVFTLLLRLHHELERAICPRHKKHQLAALGAFVDVLQKRVVEPSTFRYIVQMVLQSLQHPALQEQCCNLLSALVDAIQLGQTERDVQVLGEQLQPLVAKLVSCYLDTQEKQSTCKGSAGDSSSTTYSRSEVGCPDLIILLVQRLTEDASHLYFKWIKGLDLLPDMPVFRSIQALHRRLRADVTFADEIVQFVQRAPQLPPELRVQSLHYLRVQLHSRTNSLHSVKEQNEGGCSFSRSLRAAAWQLVQLCKKDGNSDMREFAGKLLAQVCIDAGDGHNILATTSHESTGGSDVDVVCFSSTQRDHEGLLSRIICYLMTFLTDSDVCIIELAAKSLQGVLATDKGYQYFSSMDRRQRMYLEVHSKGVNPKRVDVILQAVASDSAKHASSLDNPELWQSAGKPHDSWICELVYSLLAHVDDQMLRICQPLALHKPSFAEDLLPQTLAHLAAVSGSDGEMCQQISSQVEKHLFGHDGSSARSLQVFLDALNDLRSIFVNTHSTVPPTARKGGPTSKTSKRSTSSQSKEQQGDVANELPSPADWQSVYWLTIDYLETAKAAQKCSAIFTSILYLEHWCEIHHGVLKLGDPSLLMDNSIPEHEKLLLDAYSRMNEPDGIYGVARTNQIEAQLCVLEHEGSWSRAVENYDILLQNHQLDDLAAPDGRLHPAKFGEDYMESSYNTNLENAEYKKHLLQKGLMNSLQQSGYLHILQTYLMGLPSQERQHAIIDPAFSEQQYEAAWRISRWEDDSLTGLADGSLAILDDSQRPQFHACLYSSLRSLVDGDLTAFGRGLRAGKECLLDEITNTNVESMQLMESTAVKLQVLSSLDEAWSMRWPEKPLLRELTIGPKDVENCCKEKVVNMEAAWQQRLDSMEGRYGLLEPLFAIRRVLLRILPLRLLHLRHLWQTARSARKARRWNHAASALHELKYLQRSQSTEPSRIILPKSDVNNVFLAGRRQDLPVGFALTVSVQLTDTYGMTFSNFLILDLHIESWFSHRDILEHQFVRAVELLRNSGVTIQDGSLAHKSAFQYLNCRTQYRLAHYADMLYRGHDARLSSSQWQASLDLQEHKAKELEALKRRMKTTVKTEDKRACSVKAAELEKQLNLDKEEIQRIHEEHVNFLMIALESYRACLLAGDKYDMRVVFRLMSLWFNLNAVPRVNLAMLETINKNVLMELVTRMMIEHPYHTVYQLLSLANGDRIKARQRSKNVFVADLDKKKAAELLLDKLASKHGPLLQQMRQVVEMYIQLAEMEASKEDTQKKLAVPREMQGIRQLELVRVISHLTPASYMYGRIKLLAVFNLHELLNSVLQGDEWNGINAPKVVECLASDGHTYRQLAKSGNDDLRQDAVMEQLFELANALLRDHADTRKRRLHIRTYKVVPFTPSAGILEWVDGTVTLGEYLLGRSEKNKRKAFHTVCDNFRPVMHHFFLERFLRPSDWYEKRLAYTRSVAASSMIGYIVGLGDRHSMNLLVDEATAEIIHIDLGVAFEQGLMLKTPERVPFRLTRDIVDGMGLCGVEGVFRRCSEATLGVMRTNKEALLTIIEVFIHDPLYKWAISPLKALQRQQDAPMLDNSDSFNFDPYGEVREGKQEAARALMRVKHKLDGYEDGELRSIQGQVQQLIQDAVDPERLCTMFPGWAAWL